MHLFSVNHQRTISHTLARRCMHVAYRVGESYTSGAPRTQGPTAVAGTAQTGMHACVPPNGAAVAAKQTACARSACATRHFYKVLKTEKIEYARQYDATLRCKLSTPHLRGSRRQTGPARNSDRCHQRKTTPRRKKKRGLLALILDTCTWRIYSTTSSSDSLSVNPLNKHTGRHSTNWRLLPHILHTERPDAPPSAWYGPLSPCLLRHAAANLAATRLQPCRTKAG